MSECVEFQGCRTKRGYGKVTIKRKTHYAHRVAYCNFHGLDLAQILGDVILHKCDNPSCINPDHLTLGTQVANMQDMRNKGREAKGERHGNVILTEALVSEIRERSTGQYGEQTLFAREYGIGQSHVSQILRGVIWQQE